jgi:uncharacterized membrane protein YkoI
MKTTNRTLTAALALTLALGMTACGSDDTPTTETPGDGVAVETPAGTTTTGDATNDDTTGTASTTTDDSSTATGGGDLTGAALAAIATAETETGGVAYEIDDQDDDQAWDVHVRVDDRSVEVTVTADGSEVLQTQDDDLDSEDRAALDAATVTLAEAIEAAVNEVGGVLDDAELKTGDGQQAWEVTVDADDRDDVDVLLSLTGEVIATDS